MEPLLMWVDTFIPQAQMSQHRKGSALGWRALSSSLSLLHTRELLAYERRCTVPAAALIVDLC